MFPFGISMPVSICLAVNIYLEPWSYPGEGSSGGRLRQRGGRGAECAREPQVGSVTGSVRGSVGGSVRGSVRKALPTRADRLHSRSKTVTREHARTCPMCGDGAAFVRVEAQAAL